MGGEGALGIKGEEIKQKTNEQTKNLIDRQH